MVKIDIKKFTQEDISGLLYTLLPDSSLVTKPLHLGLSLRTKEHVCCGMKIVRHKVCVAGRGDDNRKPLSAVAKVFHTVQTHVIIA